MGYSISLPWRPEDYLEPEARYQSQDRKKVELLILAENSSTSLLLSSYSLYGKGLAGQSVGLHFKREYHCPALTNSTLPALSLVYLLF